MAAHDVAACPRPSKPGYPTVGAAKAAAAGIMRRWARRNALGIVKPLTPYRCKCGQFHLTTDTTRRRRNRRR